MTRPLFRSHRGSASFAGVVATGVMLALAGSPAPAMGSLMGPAMTTESVRVPANGQIPVRGHGYGHGHGMSQYGAEGAARAGKTYRQITAFYYPGTQRAQMKGRVRVLITSDTSDDLVVLPARGLRVRDRASGTTTRLPTDSDIRRWRLVVVDGRDVLQKLTDAWHRQRVDGSRSFRGVPELLADEPITLDTPSGARTYRGVLRSAPSSDTSEARDTVNTLSMDSYLKGVVPLEMPASWHPAAVRAQAVAARTYATWSRAQNRSRYYQICDTTSCQVYGGYGAEHELSNAAVTDTSREILTYDGAAAFTQFSSSSGGWTASGGIRYLPAQEDPFDGWSGNPVHSWSTTVNASRLQNAYPRIGNLRRLTVLSRSGGGHWGGRVSSIRLVGGKSSVTISGDSFRSVAGLRSSWFRLT